MPAHDSSWQTAWLDRAFHPLTCYLSLVSYSLIVAITGLGLAGYLTIRRSTRRLQDDGSDVPGVFASMHKSILKLTRGHFIVSNIYIIHTFALTMIDGLICLFFLKEEITGNPEKYTAGVYTHMAIFAAYLFVIFMATFVVVPMLQMLVVTWALTRFRAKTGSTSLSDYIPEARFISTHIAQIWSMSAFIVTAFWPPMSQNAFWRYVILQACVGSACSWLQAAFAFNYYVEQLETQESECDDEGVRKILRMFGSTPRVVHACGLWEKVLPRYTQLSAEEEVYEKA